MLLYVLIKLLCAAGDPIDVFKYMSKFGLPDNTCLSCALRLPVCFCEAVFAVLPGTGSGAASTQPL